MAAAASLKSAIPRGIPITVTQRARPVMTWAMAIHSPASRNQSTLPTNEPAPAPGLGTSIRPKGQMTKAARRKLAMPNGMVTMSRHIRMPTAT